MPVVSFVLTCPPIALHTRVYIRVVLPYYIIYIVPVPGNIYSILVLYTVCYRRGDEVIQ